MDIDINVLTYEGDIFKVSSLLLSQSPILREVLNPEADINISHLEIDSFSFSCILKYLQAHSITPSYPINHPIRSENIQDLVDTWDAEFIQTIDSDQLICLVNSAIKLELRPLLDLCCAFIATKLLKSALDDCRGILKNSFEFYKF